MTAPIEKSVTLSDSEMSVVLMYLSRDLSYRNYAEDDLRAQWEKKNLESALQKLEHVHLSKHDPLFRPFKKSYGGFEDMVDIERDIYWWLEHESNLPGEFTGTVKVRIDYEP